MNKCIRIMEFAEQLFDQPKVARQAGAIMQAILACQSPRISDIASRLAGRQAAAYKRVQRFLQESEPKQALRLLFNEQAEFVIGDPTEIERPHARKTSLATFVLRSHHQKQTVIECHQGIYCP